MIPSTRSGRPEASRKVSLLPHRALLPCLLLSCFTLLCGQRAALANDSALMGVGGTLRPMREHPSVRMVSERVVARLGAKVDRVTATFVLRNVGAATTVQVGFPERGWGDVGRQSAEFLSFSSTVDGVPTSIRTTPWQGEESQDLSRYRVKSVRFAPGQTRTVVVRYTARPGENSMGSRLFTYVVTTGASWKGPIGSADIRVDAARLKGYVLRSAAPRGCKARGLRFAWRFRDFVPKEEISLELGRTKAVRS